MDISERRAQRPTRDFTRETPFLLRAADDSDELPNDGWTVDGYGAVFNRLTVIDSWEGVFREQIAVGSMRKTFREGLPIMQYDHGRHPLFGSLPIADVKFAREDIDAELAPEGGAHIGARIFQQWMFEPLRDALAAQAVKHMSFRFSVVREKWETPDGKVIRDDDELISELRKTWYGDVPEEELLIRTLQELKVPEMGPVCWPAYTDTSISVRDTVIDLAKVETFDELNEDQRTALARKLWAVPKRGADQTQSGADAPQTTGDQRSSAGEHPSKPNDAPQPTGDKPAGEHPSQSIRTGWLHRVSHNELELANGYKQKGKL